MQSETLYTSNYLDGHWYPESRIVHVSVKGILTAQVSIDLMNLCAFVIVRERDPGIDGLIIDFTAMDDFELDGMTTFLEECRFISSTYHLSNFPAVLLVKSQEQGLVISRALEEMLMKPNKTIRYDLDAAIEFVQSCDFSTVSEG